jgi:hypothetical protein
MKELNCYVGAFGEKGNSIKFIYSPELGKTINEDKLNSNISAGYVRLEDDNGKNTNEMHNLYLNSGKSIKIKEKDFLDLFNFCMNWQITQEQQDRLEKRIENDFQKIFPK